MKKLLLTGAAALVLGAAGGSFGPVQAGVSAAACHAKWEAADINGDGVLTQDESELFESVATVTDADGDGIISGDEFMNACKRGLFAQRERVAGHDDKDEDADADDDADDDDDDDDHE